MRAAVVGIFLVACKDKPPAAESRAGSDKASVTANDDDDDVDPGPPDRPPPDNRKAHPDYPTPMGAGTDKLFTLEEPDRGEKTPASFDVKGASAGLAWTTHAYCEWDTVDVICSAQRSPANWRVGRRGKQVIAIPAGPTESTHVYLTRADGALDRYLEIDEYGRVNSSSRFQGDRYSNRLLDDSNGLSGCGAMAFTLKAGQSERVRCLQWSGDPMRDTAGVAAARYVRDARGFIVENHFEGLDGKPVANRVNFATKKLERDAIGRVRVTRYYDVSDQPVASAAGCHAIRYDYAANNETTKETCLDESGSPVEGSSEVAITTYKLDARGCKTAERYLDASGKPTVNDDKVHGLDYVRDRYCGERTRACVGLTGKLRPCDVEAPAKYATTRDTYGNALSIKHFDEDGIASGDAEYDVFDVHFEYDALGRFISESCFAADGDPVQCGTTGMHETRSRWDDAGRIVEERYYDSDGSPTTNYGTAIRRFVYDNYDHQYEETNHDENGELVEVNGPSTRRDLYDDRHRMFGILQLDKGGNPTMYTGCYTGVTCPTHWHALRLVRRPDGKVEKSEFFDVDGQLVETVDCRESSCFE